MRRFTDGAGRTWDVVAGRESWGAVFAIFIPYASGRPDEPVGNEIRQTPLESIGYGDASAELGALSEEGLRDLLERSEPKNPG